MRAFFFFPVVFAALLLASAPAAALKLLPFKAAIIATPAADAQGGAVQVFRLENNTNGPVAVEVYAETWDVDENGQETNQSARAEFSIFPAQLVLPPRESRAVRVVWRGAAPAQEKPFRLVAAQLPVDLKNAAADAAAVRFLLRFKAALYIRPAAAVKSDIRAEEVIMLPDGRLRLTLHNHGTAHAVLHGPQLSLTLADGGRAEIGSDVLKPLEGENIHAGRRRIFVLPRPPQLSANAEIARGAFAYDGKF